jgi:CRP/FNR family transcriptional regulator, cyclic AMP receptor protein
MSDTALRLPDGKKPLDRPEQRVPVSVSPSDSSFTVLCRAPLFLGVPNDAMVRFVSRAHWRLCSTGEVIVDCGDESNEIFFITEGSVRVVFRTSFGYEAILNDLGPGEFFGEMSAIDGRQRSANVTALLRTHLCVVPANAFLELAFSYREVSGRLLRMLATRLREKDERLVEYTVLSVRQRLISELLRLSRDRGGGERVLSPPPPQHVLASRIGTRRETVSRELAEMSRAGLLSVRRQAIILHQPQTLRSEVEARTGIIPQATSRP